MSLHFTDGKSENPQVTSKVECKTPPHLSSRLFSITVLSPQWTAGEQCQSHGKETPSLLQQLFLCLNLASQLESPFRSPVELLLEGWGQRPGAHTECKITMCPEEQQPLEAKDNPAPCAMRGKGGLSLHMLTKAPGQPTAPLSFTLSTPQGLSGRASPHSEPCRL